MFKTTTSALALGLLLLLTFFSGVAQAQAEPCTITLRGPEPGTKSPLMQYASEALKGKGGSANLGDVLIGQVISRSCSGLEEGHPLDNLCAASPPTTLAALKQALLFDIAGYGSHLLDDADTLLDPQTAEATRKALYVLQAILKGGDAKALAHTLIRRGGEPADTVPCRRPEGAGKDAEMLTVGRLIFRLDEKLAAGGDETPSEAVSAALEEITGARPTLDEGQEAAAAVLVGALEKSRKAQSGSSGRDQLISQARHLQEAVESGFAIVSGQSTSLPGAALQITEALADADLSKAFEGIQSLTGQASAYDEGIIFALQVAENPDEDAIKRLLLGAIVPGPWSDPDFIFDINASFPILDLEALDFKFTGNLTLGYNAENWGVRAHGAIYAFDIVSATEASDTTHPEGELELWLVSAAIGHWRFEGRFQGSIDFYDSTLVPLDNTNTDVLFTETSLMFRGEGFASARYERGLGAFGLWLGGGFQSESYESLRVDLFGQQEVITAGNGGLLFEGRLRGQIPFLGELLMARLRSDIIHHQITHTTLGSTGFIQQVLNQTEVYTRAFIDVEAGRFFGFVPSLNGGIDIVHRAQGDESLLSTIPVVGVGVRRVAF